MRISIVIPLFCEEMGLPGLHFRLEKVVSTLPEFQWEYIFVNDGSRDGSMDVLKDLAQKDPKTKVLDLSRNFGKEVALSAGVNATRCSTGRASW